MPKGKKKRKHKYRNPPLSPLNKFIYWALLVLGVILIFSIYILLFIWQQQVGKGNGAIAVESTASSLLFLIPLIQAVIIGIIFFEIGYQRRIPIIHPRSKKIIKFTKKHSPIMILCITLAIVLWMGSFVPVIGAVYNRTEITYTHIDVYGMFGKLEERHSIEDATSVDARIYYSNGRFSSKWEISYTVNYSDEESFTFYNTPAVITEIDSLFQKVPKTVEGSKHLDKLIDEYNCTSEESNRLKQLFIIKE